VMHFHGTEDKLVPFRGPDERTAKPLAFKSVEETIRIWTKLDGCPTTPKTIALPDKEGKGRRLTPNSCRRPQIWPCNSGPKDVVRGDRTG
jgi:poly(3-hydroxybutyrate) depolymerase